MKIIIMGVSGSGKTTIGKLLADRLGVPFYDADDFHPATNVQKMQSGQPLDDADRWPWLQTLNQLLRDKPSLILACSALRQRYRQLLAEGNPDIRWVFLDGTADLITERMKTRAGHFMPARLLDSQLATLEVPEDALRLDISRSPEELVERIIQEV